MDDFRFDLVWRRIRRDEYSKKFEGRFPYRVDRLARLVNWGALSWLHPHATASKQAHHFGVEHNATKFLDADDERRRKHGPSFRAAAHILHWGHPPLSYQSAEALLRAAHVSQDINNVLEAVIKQVLDFGSLKCADSDHEGHCARAILDAERPFELYRWLAAWITSEDWARVWDTITTAESAANRNLPDEAQVKQSLVHTLVCHEDRGFQVLRACNEADYVPRDLLQCGTAWLSLDPDVLWESDPIGPAAADEWALIESARTYLEQRFYATPTALLIHTLTARLLANSYASVDFTLDTLRQLLRAQEGDALYDKQLSPHYRTPYLRLKETAHAQLELDWWHVGTFEHISVPDGTRLSAEDFLSDRTGRNRLSFPFSEGHNLYVDIAPETNLRFAGSNRQYATVHCHHHREGPHSRARPMLNSLAKIENWSRRRSARLVGNAIVSWLLNESVTQATTDIEALLNEVIASDAKPYRAAAAELRQRSSYVEFNEHGDTAFIADLMTETDFGLVMAGGDFFLRIPWRGMRLAAGKSMLRNLHEVTRQRATTGDGGERGAALELAVATDQLLDDTDCAHRFLMINATQWGLDRRPVREWDVLRIDLIPDGTWRVVAIECAVKRTIKKDEDAQDRFEILQKALRGSYADFASYETYFATIKDGQLHYEDAGRSFKAS